MFSPIAANIASPQQTLSRYGNPEITSFKFTATLRRPAPIKLPKDYFVHPDHRFTRLLEKIWSRFFGYSHRKALTLLAQREKEAVSRLSQAEWAQAIQASHPEIPLSQIKAGQQKALGQLTNEKTTTEQKINTLERSQVFWLKKRLKIAQITNQSLTTMSHIENNFSQLAQIS